MSQPPSPQTYSPTQKIALVVLIVALAATLLVLRHRRDSAADITLVAGDSSAYAFKVDINTADWQELSLLPGIGETKARQIVDYRDLHGPFQSASDLAAVDGIGEKTISGLEPYISVGKPSE